MNNICLINKIKKFMIYNGHLKSVSRTIHKRICSPVTRMSGGTEKIKANGLLSFLTFKDQVPTLMSTTSLPEQHS